MRRAVRPASGQVTVFVSLVMMCIFSFFCVLLESARTAGARWYLRTAASSAMDSVFSQYHRQLWDDYRVLFAEYETEEELAADFLGYLEAYTQAENWYPMEIAATEASEVCRATDGDGWYLEQEILDYMTYGVWNLDFGADTVQELWDDGTEAVSVTGVATLYQEHSKEALALEKSLEAISESLSRQKEYKSRGLSELSDYDCSGFIRVANQLIDELERIPGLVETYQKKADTLAEGLEESRSQADPMLSDCSDQVNHLLEQEISEYDAYVAADGERRQEIEALTDQSRQQIALVREVIEEAREAQRRVDEYDDDDEDDDGPDLSAIWRPVRRHFNTLQISELSFTHGVEDKEKEGWLNQITTMYQTGLLSLLVPEDMEVSGRMVDLSEAPTAGREDGGNRSVAFLDRLLIDEYGGRFFRNFRDTAESGGSTGDPAGTGQEEGQGETSSSGNETGGASSTVLSYEVEYLIHGADTDRENLTDVANRLLAMREGLNLIHILSSSEKRTQAMNLAMAITGLASATPLVLVTMFFVMTVWALAESLADIKGLLSGKKVPLIKTDSDWYLGTDELLAMGRDRTVPAGGGENGFSYLSWLKILLFMDDTVQQEYRMMDLMQMNMRLLQDGFRMKNGVCRAEVSAQVNARHVFFSLGFVSRMIGGGDFVYPMRVFAERSYSQ
ncbi:MAG: DUF5702 domain-containing protein [Clostridiales bacterium]|nr:DUF5702 domain-containing protein [Clostridiales bacterium]